MSLSVCDICTLGTLKLYMLVTSCMLHFPCAQGCSQVTNIPDLPD